MGSEVVSNVERMDDPDFRGFELLLFRRFQCQPSLWYEWRDKLKKQIDPDDGNSSISNHPKDAMALSALIEEISNLGVRVSIRLLLKS